MSEEPTTIVETLYYECIKDTENNPQPIYEEVCIPRNSDPLNTMSEFGCRFSSSICGRGVEEWFHLDPHQDANKFIKLQMAWGMQHSPWAGTPVRELRTKPIVEVGGLGAGSSVFVRMAYGERRTYELESLDFTLAALIRKHLMGNNDGEGRWWPPSLNIGLLVWAVPAYDEIAAACQEYYEESERLKKEMQREHG